MKDGPFQRHFLRGVSFFLGSPIVYRLKLDLGGKACFLQCVPSPSPPFCWVGARGPEPIPRTTPKVHDALCFTILVLGVGRGPRPRPIPGTAPKASEFHICSIFFLGVGPAALKM